MEPLKYIGWTIELVQPTKESQEFDDNDDDIDDNKVDRVNVKKFREWTFHRSYTIDFTSLDRVWTVLGSIWYATSMWYDYASTRASLHRILIV